jgi:FkbM family methyltransferase
MSAPAENIIWQYWETRGAKPAYIDGLHDIAQRNAGVKVVLVTPETLSTYLPDLEPGIHAIGDLAHKADMIRTRLVARHGGMWLDSDAVVMSDLSFLFDELKTQEFVGFNNASRLQHERPWIRVCCFLSRPGGVIVSEWARRQGLKLPRTAFAWSEIGAMMLNEICVAHRDRLTVLPFERICPVPPKQVGDFMLPDDRRAERIAKNCYIVMLTNRAQQKMDLPLQRMSVEEIAASGTLLARILQKARDPNRDRNFARQTEAPPAPSLIEVDTAHGRIWAFEHDFITKQILKFGAHTRPEIALLSSMVEPGDAIFDLGAHIGTYAIPLARKAGRGGRLLAVEGARENFAVLEKNLAAAALDAETTAVNALIAPAGVSYAAHTPDGNTGGTLFTPVLSGGTAIETASVDELCARHFTPRVMKVDIEGGEVFALAGSRMLERARPIVYAEVNGKLLIQQGTSIAAMETVLRALGYRLFRNVGARHAAHDNFTVAELETLPTNLNNFDVLAVHRDDERLARLVAR